MVGAASSCPQCGTALRMRLGELECPACGHVQPAAGGAAAREKSQDHGGVHRVKLLNLPSSAPAPGDPGLPYYGASSWESSVGADAGYVPATDTLHREKVIYFAIEIGLMLLAAASSLFPDTPGGAETGVYEFFGSLFGAGFDLLLLWFVLFSDVSCLKWGCLISTGLNVIGVLIIAVVAVPLAISSLDPSAQASGLTGVVTAVIVVALLIAVAWRAWLAWILWRDLQSGSL
jgi:hypothetical protein